MYRIVYSLNQLDQLASTPMVTDDLEQAMAWAKDARGVVVRTADDAVLAPDGTWIVPVRKVG